MIAKNFYWLNVTRFYAGCFSRGELAALVDALEEVIESDGYRYLAFPRSLCSMLLKDWVFSQQPKTVEKIVELMTGRNGLRLHLASSRHIHVRESLQLPEKCGRRWLVEKCFAELGQAPHADYGFGLCAIVNANASSEEKAALWLGYWQDGRGQDRGHWLAWGSRIGVFRESVGVIRVIWEEIEDDRNALTHVIRGEGGEFMEDDPKKFMLAFGVALNDGDLSFGPYYERREGSIISMLRGHLDPRIYMIGKRLPPRETPMGEVVARYGGFNLGDSPDTNRFAKLGKIGEECKETFETIQEQAKLFIGEWMSSLQPWSQIVEKARIRQPLYWRVLHLAICAVGMVPARLVAKWDKAELFDEAVPLCERIHSARRRRAAQWWRECILRDDPSQRKLGLAVALSVATPAVIRDLEPILDELLVDLNSADWEDVWNAVTLSVSVRRGSAGGFQADWLSVGVGPRLAVVCAARASKGEAKRIYEASLMEYGGDDRIVWSFCQECALDRAINNVESWQHSLRVVRRSYAQGVISYPELYFQLASSSIESEGILAADVAAQICAAPHLYPMLILAAAEARRAAEVRGQVRAVGQVAEENGWFTNT